MAGIAESGINWRELFRVATWVLAALVLLLPLVAMQFTAEVVWDGPDFAVAGAFLFGACGAYELAARRTNDVSYLAAVGVVLLTAVLLIWVNLAVGIIGSEGNPANLMYGGTLCVGIIGAIVARFRPRGMARALTATAVAQTVVGIVALVAGLGSTAANWPAVIVVLTGFFAALWLASAWLFRRAARKQETARSVGGRSP
jgi:hypothetical protein